MVVVVAFQGRDHGLEQVKNPQVINQYFKRIRI